MSKSCGAIKKTNNWYLTDLQTRCVPPAVTISKAFTFQHKRPLHAAVGKKGRFCSSVDLWTLKCLTSYMWDMHQSADHNKQLVFKIMTPQISNLKLNICCLMNWCTRQKAMDRGTKIFLHQNRSQPLLQLTMHELAQSVLIQEITCTQILKKNYIHSLWLLRHRPPNCIRHQKRKLCFLNKVSILKQIAWK